MILVDGQMTLTIQ